MQDFANIDLNTVDPEQLESLYLASHVQKPTLNSIGSRDNISILSTATTTIVDKNDDLMTVTIKSFDSHSLHNKKTFLRAAFRNKKIQTLPFNDLSSHSRKKLYFPVSFHSLLFDTLKLDIVEQRPFLSNLTVGRVRIKLHNLSLNQSEILQTFPILPKKIDNKNPTSTSLTLGNITINIKFSGPSFGTLVENFTEEPENYSDLSDDIDDEEKLKNESQVKEFVEVIEDEIIHNEANNFSNSQVTQQTKSIQLQQRSRSYSRTRSDVSKTARSISGVSTSTSSVTAPVHSYSSMTEINSGSIRGRVSTKRGTVFSERTKLGIREIAEFASSFFWFGFQVGKKDFVKSLLVLRKYFTDYYPNPRTYDVVKDTEFLKETMYWMKFCTAAYGSIVMNYCGTGRGYLRDLLQVKADKKTAIKSLGIQKEDMLVWEYGTGLEMFKPKFYIARDKKTNSIVVCFRGTFDVHDFLTDINAEYEPFLGGHVHRGILRTAKWVEEHYMDAILNYVKTYECENLYILGHSLGGAIGTIFTMILREKLPILKENPNFKKLYCYTHGTPACASENLAEEFKSYVDVFINENDNITRLSYGSMLDFRAMIIAAHNASKTKGSTEDKMKMIDIRRKQLKESEENPKQYVVGNIYYIYKTSRMYGKKGEIFGNDSHLDFNDERKLKRDGHPLIRTDVGHYVVEKTDKRNFLSVQIQQNLLYHHFPNKYLNGMQKSIDWLSRNTTYTDDFVIKY
ncbi:hypothetical protein HK099_002737 [Clydaea vesicula]|uniref:sn-1-specific diacylglycerol lipase n=1 Tax=Clydaea vesicula TaxID=447962 RepID=A0AAD5XWL0_9FUNG|nr:hypothetical protein HK099_002737 [Clydaea vesicula]KAJ3377995.1 hypothetical protein HDU92_007775 [Lobulomyces angularis]